MFIQTNGVELYVENHTDHKLAPRDSVIFVHGMTLNGLDWQPVIQSLDTRWNPVTLDLIGHGRSGSPDTSKLYRIDAVVDQIKNVVDELDLDKARWVGYSMGGRILLQFAVRHPEFVESMILESTTPGIESDSEREKRRQTDVTLAEYLLDHGLEAFVDRWLNASIFDSQQSVSERKRERARELRLQNSPEGLAHCLRELGRGKIPHLWDCLDKLTMPVKLLTGTLDTKHCQIHERMHGKLPDSTKTVIDDVGHNVHFENPEIFVEECENFFAH